MLQPPKRPKYRKWQKGRNRGYARSTAVKFGAFGLQSLEHSQINARQIEAVRRVLSRHFKKSGRIFITLFPDKPITKKPLEVRQGKGKGNVEYYVSLVKPGTVMFEVSGVPEAEVRSVFKLASAKLPVKTRMVKRFIDDEDDEYKTYVRQNFSDIDGFFDGKAISRLRQRLVGNTHIPTG